MKTTCAICNNDIYPETEIRTICFACEQTIRCYELTQLEEIEVN